MLFFVAWDMNPKKLFLFPTLLLSSCGLLGIATTNDPNVSDPAKRDAMLTQMENTPLAKCQDSLLAKIDAATVSVPAELAGTTLIIEIYDYPTYAKTYSLKYHWPDSAKLKKNFLKYSKSKETKRLLENPKHQTVYAHHQNFDKLDPAVYRFVLKQTVRMNADRDTLKISEAGFVSPFVATAIYYLYDRQTGAVFREIEDLQVLEK